MPHLQYTHTLPIRCLGLIHHDFNDYYLDYYSMIQIRFRLFYCQVYIIIFYGNVNISRAGGKYLNFKSNRVTKDVIKIV